MLELAVWTGTRAAGQSTVAGQATVLTAAGCRSISVKLSPSDPLKVNVTFWSRVTSQIGEVAGSIVRAAPAAATVVIRSRLLRNSTSWSWLNPKATDPVNVPPALGMYVVAAAAEVR